MRKILTGEEIAAREKKRNRVLTVIMLLIMLLILVVSSAGYAFLSIVPEPGQAIAAGGKVQAYGSQWAVIWAGNQHVFSSSPEMAFNNTTLDFIPDINKYAGKPLYIDAESDVVANEIASNLGIYSERPNRACYLSCEDSDLPEKNCTYNLIIYKPGDENKITQEDGCIFINGDIKAVDAFLYREIGIA